jgi:hypothetical protein
VDAVSQGMDQFDAGNVSQSIKQYTTTERSMLLNGSVIKSMVWSSVNLMCIGKYAVVNVGYVESI